MLGYTVTAGERDASSARKSTGLWRGSLHRDGNDDVPSGRIGNEPESKPALVSSRQRFFSDTLVLLGGGISRKLVENICPAVTWWLRAPRSNTSVWYRLFRFRSVVVPHAKTQKTPMRFRTVGFGAFTTPRWGSQSRATIASDSIRPRGLFVIIHHQSKKKERRERVPRGRRAFTGIYILHARLAWQSISAATRFFLFGRSLHQRSVRRVALILWERTLRRGLGRECGNTFGLPHIKRHVAYNDQKFASQA